MEVVSFKAKYLRAMVLQDAQQIMSPLTFDDEYCEQLVDAGPAYTILDGNKPIMCAGVAEMWTNRYAAWAWLSKDAGPKMVGLTRIVDDYLNTRPYKRIEAYVDARFDAGHRWIQMLGFEREGYMRAFSPLGKDCILYARIKHG